MSFEIDPLWQPTYNPGISDLEIPRIAGANPQGFVLLDKPLGKTSHDLVSWGRRLAGTKKVGHAGTLDPDASGILILGLGRATKFIQYLQGMPKTYTARIRFGQTTDTEDASGRVLENRAVSPGLDLAPYFTHFRGEYLQVPSSVSAKKIEGKRAYQLVREGKLVELAPVPVQIYDLQAISELEPVKEQGLPMYEIEVQVRCSAGTYIRALARDLGEMVGVGAHLRALRRVAVGPYQVEKDCFSMATLASRRLAGEELPVLPVDAVVGELFKGIEFTEAQLRDLSFGKLVKQSALQLPNLNAQIDPNRLESSLEKTVSLSADTVFAASFPKSRAGDSLVALVKTRQIKGQNYWQPVFVWQSQIRE